MATCPNKTLPKWGALVESVGEDMSYYLWDLYKGDVPADAIDSFSSNEEGVVAPPAYSKRQIAALKDWLGRLGVDITSLDPERYGGLSAVTNLTEKWIALSKGREVEFLPEEAFHVGVAIIKQTHPSLYKEMLNAIGSYEIYGEIFDEYKNFPEYQQRGRPDIIKIKEEAIGRVLATTYGALPEEQLESFEKAQKAQSWLSRMMDAFKYLIGKAGFNPFESGVKTIANITISQADTILGKASGEFYHAGTEFTSPVPEAAIQELDKYLLDFLKPFGVSSRSFDSLKEKLGVDTFGATDVLNKLIWYTKNRTEETVPEEMGHMVTMLMGLNHPVIKELLTNIHNWSEFQEIRSEYLPIYQNEQQVKIEAIGKLLAKSLVKNYKANGLNKSLLQRTIDAVEKLLKDVLSIFNVSNYSLNLADKVAVNILAGNTDFVASLKPSAEKLDYNKAMESNPLAQRIMEKFQGELGHALTGSLAIAGQGETIYRPSATPIHDLDFRVNGGDSATLEKLADALNEMGAVSVHLGWRHEAEKFTTFAYYIPKEGYTVRVLERGKTGWSTAVEVKDKDGNVVEMNSENVIATDFFVYFDEKAATTPTKFANWNDIFHAKLILGKQGKDSRFFEREKDQTDYILSMPQNRSVMSNPAFIYYQLKPGATTDNSTQGERLFHLVRTNKGIPISKQEATATEKRHYIINTTQKIYKTVTDRTARYYERIRKNLSVSEYEKLKNDFVAEEGIAGHKDMEQIQKSLTDPDTGLLIPNPVKDTSYKPLTSQAIYDKLYDYMVARMNQFPPGTRFLAEVLIYDEIQKEAGTIDFLAITPEGVATILDWKFQDLMYNGKFKADVPWYKKTANNMQLSRYKQILTRNYGITKWSNDTAAIPIAAHYKYTQRRKAQGDTQGYPELAGITIGDADVSKITETALLPVVLTNASTGDAQLDKIVFQLKEAGTILEHQRRGTPDFRKRTQLTTQIDLITKAVRHLQVQKSLAPMIDQANEFLARTTPLVAEYHNTIKGKDYDANKQVFNDFAVRVQRAFTELDIYKDLPQNTGHLFTDLTDPVYLATKQLSFEAQTLRGAILNMTREFVDQLATTRNIQNINSAELVISGQDRLFTETSKLPTAAFNLFSQLRTEAKHRADFTTNEQNTQLMDIQKRYMAWAKGKGLSTKNLFSPIMNPNEKNQLLDQYSVEFYKEGREAAKKKDSTWVKDNVDMDKFRAELIRLEELEIEVIDSRSFLTEEDRQKEIDRVVSKYNLDTRDSNGWSLYHTFRLFPKEKHTTKQWTTLHSRGNEPAKEFYDWIIEINKKAEAYGYLPEGLAARTFLPWVPQSLIEQLVEGRSPKALVDAFWHSITVDEATVGLGEFDEETGKVKQKIPAYLLSPSTQGNSEMLFRNMGLYNQFVNEYGELSEIEGLALAIGRVEENKKSMETSILGNPIMRGGTIQEQNNNDTNFKLYEDHRRALMYGEKYVKSDRFDVVLGKVNPILAGINKAVGVKFFPENLGDRQISMNRLIEATNNYFQLKALGGNPITAGVNRMGGFFQSIVNAGTWFNRKDVLKGELEVLSKHISGEEGKKFIAACRYFMPFTENANQEVLKKLAGSWLDAQNMQDWLMVMMRSGDRGVQAQVFNALWNNMILMDGKIVNAREYYRKSAEYTGRYAPGVSAAQRSRMEANFDNEVNKLIAKFGVKKQSSVDSKGMLVIPGIDRNSPTVHQARTLSQEISKKTTGQMTDDEVRGYQMNIYLKSMMIFKNWIPSLLDVRMGSLKYNNKTHAYEWGRTRTFARYMMTDTMNALTALLNGAKATEKGMEGLQKLYEAKKEAYEKTTGQEFPMGREEFFDLVRNNMRQNARDAIVTLSLILLWMMAKANPPDEDEDALVKNRHKFMVKALDKLKDEMSFFYNPFSAEAILNGTLFPSFGIITDGISLLSHFAQEMWGLSWKNDKFVEDNKVMKYLWRSFPITSQISSYLPLFAPDAAKEYGIRVSAESRPKR